MQLERRESILVEPGISTADSRFAACMSDLLDIISSSGSELDIANSFCGTVSRLVPCDLVVIERRISPGAPPVTIGAWSGSRESWEEDRIDCELVREVYESRRPCFDSSLHGQGSAMAAPLFELGQLKGVLYVRSESREISYDVVDLRALTSVASGVAFKLHSLDLDVDVRQAESIQRRMLPRSCMEVAGYEIEGFLQSCEEVGGDLYQCLPMLGGNKLLVVGDVTGKGVPAAFCMSAAASLLALLVETIPDLDELVLRAHRHLFEHYSSFEFLTLFAVEVEPNSGRLRYVNAGHEQARWVRGDGSIVQLESTGPPLALVEVETFDVASIQLEPGDLLAIFSDGIPEATVDWERFLGGEAIDDLLRAHRREPLPTIRERIIQQVLEFVGPDGITDDTTLVLLRRTDDSKAGKNPRKGRKQ